MPADQEAQMKMRVDRPLHKHLEEAAAARGVSMNREIVDRLRLSLDAWPPNPMTQPIFAVLDEAMQSAGESALFALTQSWELARKRDWLDDPYAYEKAVEAAIAVLEAFKPTSEKHAPETITPWNGEFWAKRAIKMAASGQPNVPEMKERALRLHRSVGRLSARMSAWLNSTGQ
jgi:hypothetical protein